MSRVSHVPIMDLDVIMGRLDVRHRMEERW